MKFNVNTLSFSAPKDPMEKSKEGIVTKAALRRKARLKEAQEAIPLIPGPGETLHGLMTGSYDLMHLLIVLLDQLGNCKKMQIATLSLSVRNVLEMAELLDAKKIENLDILVSDFFHKHDKAIFSRLFHEFSNRGQKVAAARSHCKIVTLEMVDGRKFVLEGSANLRTNKNIEQFCLTQDASLHGYFSDWITEMVEKYEIRSSDHEQED